MYVYVIVMAQDPGSNNAATTHPIYVQTTPTLAVSHDWGQTLTHIHVTWPLISSVPWERKDYSKITRLLQHYLYPIRGQKILKTVITIDTSW